MRMTSEENLGVRVALLSALFNQKVPFSGLKSDLGQLYIKTKLSYTILISMISLFICTGALANGKGG